jgi:hypothetical protein
MKKALIQSAGAAMALFTGSAAMAGIPSATINQNIFGSNYNVSIFRVGGDIVGRTGAGANAGRLEPEGMVFHNGTLYVSGDGSTAETNGYLAAYSGGNLAASPSVQGRFTATVGSNTAAFGPEGLAVNTRGSGYGSFTGGAGRIVGADNVVSPVSTRVLGVYDLDTTTLTNTIPAFPVNADDITYVPGASASEDRFALIDGTDVRSSPTGSAFNNLVWYTAGNTPVATGASFPIPLGAKGLLYLSAADAALFSPLATGDSLLVASSPASDSVTLESFINRLSLYSLDGTLIAQSNIVTGAGIVGRFGNIEALAYDSSTRRLFLGDEASGNSQIAVLTIPAPGVGAMLLAFAGVVSRRRR